MRISHSKPVCNSFGQSLTDVLYEGTLSTGAGLNYVRATGGKVESIDGYSGLKLRATVNDGDDWITVDNDGKRLRLDAKMLMK